MFILQIAILENDLHLLSRGVGDIDHRPDVLADVIPFAAEYLADVDDHVQFLAAVGQRLLGLGAL